MSDEKKSCYVFVNIIKNVVNEVEAIKYAQLFKTKCVFWLKFY